MAEQTFRSPGFFEQEIDLSQRQSAPTGTPGGVVGTAKMGPAFVPITVGSFADFENKFGGLDANRFGPYAVNEFLKHKQSLTYLRVLGAGANSTAADMGNTEQLGIVKNAGFVLSASNSALGGADVTPTDNPSWYSQGHSQGAVQFICAKHFLSSSGGELVGFPVFSDNDSFIERENSGETDIVNLVRAMVMLSSGTRLMIADDTDYIPMVGGLADRTNNFTLDDYAMPIFTGTTDYNFKIILSSSSGKAFGNDDGIAGFRIMSASLNPSSELYVGKILNLDPTKFQDEEHLLYADFAVENELAPVAQGQQSVAITSGSAYAPETGDGTKFRDRFGRFDTRYSAPKTTAFISQPFGNVEYNLFHFEALSDGAYANDQYKISIANLRASTDPRNQYGTFEVQVRKFSDTDTNLEVLETFPECNLDPNSDRYVGRVVGDKKVYYDFDAEQEDERRLVVQGKYPNVSAFVRIVMNDAVEKKDVPATALPFGFRGVAALKTSDSLTDVSHVTGSDHLGRQVPPGATSANQNRMTAIGVGVDPGFAAAAYAGKSAAALTGSIIPPLPFRFKATRGAVASSAAFVGEAGKLERADARLYWGVKFERLPQESSVTNAILNSNIGGLPNNIVRAYTKFIGLPKMDNLVTGSAADTFNNNKFTLSRVALYNELPLSEVSGTAKSHMKDAAYIRNGVPSSANYTIPDPIEKTRTRITLGTLLQSSSILFNRFSGYAKFTNILHGGFDGLNILDTDNLYMTDKGSSSDPGGKAATDYTDTGLLAGNVAGIGKNNNIVFAYREGARVMTDPMTVNTNILAIPGIRDSFVTDEASDGVKNNSMIIYLMDIPQYDASGVRLFDDRASTSKPDVRETAEQLEGRTLDNNYTATYFPDVVITDDHNGRNVNVPPSIPALGALAYNDFIGYPWFAPAGFNRGALEQVQQVDVRLTSGDRDVLYDARINPIATFPNGGGKPTFVIFGQKTLQMAKTALDRVNVRRMLLEVKRLVVSVADRILFEPNTASTRASFVGQILPLLALVQAQAGIESFQVICDGSNNSQADVETNKMNGRIVIVPTRTVEFVAIDFIITNSGVSFE